MRYLLLLALAASPASAQECVSASDDVIVPSFISLARKCVIEEQVPKLVKSGETADLVAIAAVANCKDWLIALRNSMAGCERAKTISAIDTEVRKRLRDDAIAAAINLRAKR